VLGQGLETIWRDGFRESIKRKESANGLGQEFEHATRFWEHLHHGLGGSLLLWTEGFGNESFHSRGKRLGKSLAMGLAEGLRKGWGTVIQSASVALPFQQVC
jgi:hypothetical protein